MDNLTPQSNPEQESPFSHPHALRDILIVATPIVVLGAVGNMIGLSTLVGGTIINLGYVLATSLNWSSNRFIASISAWRSLRK